jgi:hypothetical protein
MFEIINTTSEEDVKDEYVAIGTYVSDLRIPQLQSGTAYHSLLIIKYKGEIWQFHYTGDSTYGIIFDQEIDTKCFHKITNTIDVKLIPSFIMMCKRILKNANPKYGYFYSGEFYDLNGQHFSESKIGERMTCSGFCINVLKGFLEEDYLVYTDWNSTSHETENYLKDFCNLRGLDIFEIEGSHRRISPLELLCSGYFTKLPITKEQINSKIGSTEEYLRNY